MVMDAKNTQSDLQALKRLYGLLQKDGDGTSYMASDSLDERARFLLKNLLDAASRIILKQHSELIASRTKLSRNAQGGRSFKQELDSDKTSAPGYRNKRCRVCQKSTTKQLESIEETLFYDAVENPNIFSDQQNNESDHYLLNSQQDTGLLLCNKTDESESEKGSPRGGQFVSDLYGIGYGDFSSDRLVTDNFKAEEFDCLSKEASEAIKQIELCISALHIGTDYHLPQFAPHRNRVLETKSTAPATWTQYGAVPSVDMSRTANKFHAQNVKAIVGKIEPGNWKMGCNHLVPTRVRNFQDFSVAVDPTETSDTTPSWQAHYSSASKMAGPYRSHMALPDQSNKCKLLQTYKPPDSFMKPNNNEMLLRPSFQEKDATRKKRRNYTTEARTALRREESEGTATNSNSSSWTSRQNSSRNSDSEEYSSSDQSGELEHVTSSMNSESEASGSQYSSYTSTTEANEVYSSTSGEAEAAREVTSSNSSKTEGYSSYDRSIPRIRTKSKTSGSIRISRAVNGTKHKKLQSGVWRRLKDKLAIIFHHHHHHHHHHNHGNDQRKMGRNSSLQKRRGKVLNFKRRDEACGEKAVEKTSKSLVHEKNQQNHFHELMGGLLRHVKHSKKSKPRKEAVAQLAKGRHSRKTALNKSHWWQLVQNQRGAKLPGKAHVKLGLGKKRAHLKVLPKPE